MLDRVLFPSTKSTSPLNSAIDWINCICYLGNFLIRSKTRSLRQLQFPSKFLAGLFGPVFESIKMEIRELVELISAAIGSFNITFSKAILCAS
jgi:hypothetical protein